MITVAIAPLPKMQFNQGGVPLAGGLLFTYAAGTTTKLASYTDSTGATPNTNPIVLNANGEADVYLIAGDLYKLTLCPATDTDPPTNPYWSVDNLYCNAASAIPYADATGTSDVITATYVVTSPVLVDGFFLILDIVTANTTTTPTFAPTLNGVLQTARTIQKVVGNANVALAVGDLQGMAMLVYDLSNLVWILQNPQNTGVTSDTKLPTITATVAANALTIGASPQYLDFRSATITSGAISTIYSAPSNLVVPSTATLGTTNAVSSRLAIIEINNSGVAELAVVNQSGGSMLDETTLISTTAISASANSANVIYSTTARTGVPFKVLGYIDITEATAGTWASGPTAIRAFTTDFINKGSVTIASSTTPDIFSADSDSISYTGTATCTGFASAAKAGMGRKLICTGACLFTAGANLIIEGIPSGQTITLAANAIVDVLAISTTQFKMNYSLSGTFTATGTGFTANPTTTATYSVRDGVCALSIPAGALTGTSNATTFTVTGLPACITPASLKYFPWIWSVDSGSVPSSTSAYISAGSPIITLSRGALTGGAWTNSGTKTLNLSEFIYTLS
jgi:hypothetical protein